MSKETPTIKASKRDRIGSRYASRLRKAGRLPAVIYGHKTEPVSVSIDAKETVGYLRRGMHVMNVELEGAKSETCLVKELQFGFLGDDVIHVDFTRVDLDEEVEVKVHLRFIGTPESAKQAGAVLTTDLTDLEVMCKVRDIPGEIKVDLSGMEQQLVVSQLTLPPGVRPAEDPNKIVAHISFVAEEVVGEQVAIEGAVAEPEVITEAKREAAEGEEAAEAKP